MFKKFVAILSPQRPALVKARRLNDNYYMNNLRGNKIFRLVLIAVLILIAAYMFYSLM